MIEPLFTITSSKLKDEMSSPFGDQLAYSAAFNTEEDVVDNRRLLESHLRNWLQTKGFDREEALFDLLLEKKGDATRKDGKTPSCLHEMLQAVYMISHLEDGYHIEDPKGVLGVIFCHDLGEEYGLKPDELRQYLNDKGFADNEDMQTLLSDFKTISLNFKGEEPQYANKHDYSMAVRQSQNASVAKLFDNLQNISTTLGGLSDERAGKYNGQIQLQIHGFIRETCKNFPTQKQLYQAVGQVVDFISDINRHDLFGKTIKQPLEIDEDSFPKRGLSVPPGVNPILMAANRVWHRNAELKPDYLNEIPDDNPALTQ